jgi:hypothetical protein
VATFRLPPRAGTACFSQCKLAYRTMTTGNPRRSSAPLREAMLAGRQQQSSVQSSWYLYSVLCTVHCTVRVLSVRQPPLGTMSDRDGYEEHRIDLQRSLLNQKELERVFRYKKSLSVLLHDRYDQFWVVVRLHVQTNFFRGRTHLSLRGGKLPSKKTHQKSAVPTIVGIKVASTREDRW